MPAEEDGHRQHRPRDHGRCAARRCRRARRGRCQPGCCCRRRSRPCLGRRDPTRRAGRRPRLDLARRSRLGEREHHRRASPRRQGGHGHRAGALVRGGDEAGPDRAPRRSRGSTRPRHRRPRRSRRRSTGGRCGRRGLVGLRPRDHRPSRSRRRGDPSGRHDILAARPPRRLPRCDRHRLALAPRAAPTSGRWSGSACPTKSSSHRAASRSPKVS